MASEVGVEKDLSSLKLDDQTQLEKKVKKKKKSKSKSKKKKATGFEEFYTDPPLTPEQFKEEREAYDSAVSFAQRILECIQRYRSKRRFSSQRSNIFDKYLTFGGIDCTQKTFTGGIDPETLENMTAGEIAAVQAQDMLGTGGNQKYYSTDQSEHWAIDFEGVVKGFLSQRAPSCIDFSRDSNIRDATGVIRNFLSYVLLHDACPEYEADVVAARAICDIAEEELLKINYVNQGLPSTYNETASRLFGGFHHEFQQLPNVGDEKYESWKAISHLFEVLVGLTGNDKQIQNVLEGNVKLLGQQTGSFEVVRLIHPEEQTINSSDWDALGKLIVKPWCDPSAPPEDISDSGDDELSLPSTEIELWLESELLQYCFESMHFSATLFTLSEGINFFDRLEAITCSFFTYLENDKMMEWKDPKPSNRRGPTVDNPNVEDMSGEDGEDDGALSDDVPMTELDTV